MHVRKEVKESLNKSYLEFIEDMHFDLEKFHKDLDTVKHKLNRDLIIYLQNATEKKYIKEALLKFLSTDYSEELDWLFSQQFNIIKNEK